MSILKNSLLKVPKINIYHLMKYSIHSKDSTGSLDFESKITQEESAKVLNTLNESDSKLLSRYKIAQSKIKHIEKWKSNKGPFQSLEDILEIDGFSENMLRNICKNIINENILEQDISSTLKPVTTTKRFKHLLTPPLNGLAEELNSATGVHVTHIGVSWARLSREENKLTSWGFEDFCSLPKKMLPTETFLQAFNIVKRIPPSDVYIFESNVPLSPNSQTQTAIVSSYNQQVELTSMLLALLNTSINHNVTLKIVNDDETVQHAIENRVFFLKAKLSARLFRTLVGKEKVASISIVNKLIQSDSDQKFELPCAPITVEQTLKDIFDLHSSTDKELLGQALLLVVSFMDLCVLKNSVSLKAVFNNKAMTS